jgi:cysteine desulfurase
MHYLDNSATTQPYLEVIETVSYHMQHHYGNPSSLHRLGFQAEQVVEEARQIVAKELHATASEVIFTSGGTEANNFAITGVTKSYQNRGKHLITTQIEHDSVYEVYQQLEREGFTVTYLPVDEEGKVSVEQVQAALTPETILVSIMHVNNEIGSIQPITEVGQLLSKYPKIFFHVDAVQSFAKVPIDVKKMGIDLLSLSAHKFHGPKGVGALYLRKNKRISPLLIGGGQEQGFRSGTLAVPLIAGLAKAVTQSVDKRSNFFHEATTWKSRLQAQIASLEKTLVNVASGVPYIINFSCPGVKSEVIVHALEAEGIYVSSKSACSSKNESPSRVLLSLGRNRNEAISGIRISLGMLTTESDIIACEQAISNVIPTLQQWIKV